MHAALLADTAWVADEQAMFHFLVVGLMDEQVRVAHVVPHRAVDQHSIAFGEHVAWHDTRLEWIRRHRLGVLAATLDELRINLLHALDGRLWQGTLRLAARLGVPAVLNATCARDVARAKALRRQIGSCRAAFAAATEPLGEGIRQHMPDTSLLEVVPLGAHIPPDPNPLRNPEALCVLITGNGVYDAQYQALFEALAKLIADHPETLLFFDSQGDDGHQFWQATRRHGLLANSSMIPGRLSRRELLTGAHLLIQPQALGRARGLTLQAMACGMPVLARQDPWLDYLVNDQTAWLAEQGDVETWGRLIHRSVEDAEAARDLGASARRWIAEHHLASAHVQRTIDLYHRLVPDPYKFPQESAASNGRPRSGNHEDDV